MITLEDWITSSGSYPTRATSNELTDEVKANAKILVNKINDLFSKLSITAPKISSGFRPSVVNSALPNSAKKSYHCTGLAVDFSDPKGEVKKLAAAHPEELRKLGLFMEDPASTPSWAHFDYGSRSDRPSRIFKP